jgi:hypothetical protein
MRFSDTLNLLELPSRLGVEPQNWVNGLFEPAVVHPIDEAVGKLVENSRSSWNWIGSFHR